MKKIWNTITTIGITEDIAPREARRISYLNVMTSLILGYLTIRAALSLSTPEYAIKLAILTPFPAIVLILNKLRFHTASKISAVLFFTTATTLFSYFLVGGFSGIYALLFAFLPLPFILFDIKQKVHILITLGYTLACFIVLIVLQYVNPRPPVEFVDIAFIHTSSTVLTIFVILLSTWHFYSSNQEAEEKLAREKERSEAANRAKSTFLANMSHELRTPLNVILGYSQLMVRDPALSKEQEASLETISRSGDHLLSLINDVLEFSKIEAGKTELYSERFDLHKLLFGLEGMFRLRSNQKGISLEVSRGIEVPRYIRADRNKLSQVLINLLGNAVKFTQQGNITLGVQFKNHYLNFSVSDTGIGISQKEQKKIFDTFFQTKGIQENDAGTGLGLSISQKYIELMGGNLSVKSNEGQGSRFDFAIPVELTNSLDEESNFSNMRVIGLEPGQPEVRLLVAEDNLDSRDLLATLLQSVGFVVREAVNGREAIDIWQEWQPHLVCMDLRMPVIDGIQAMSEIRQLPGGENTKIIALTAHAFEEERQHVIEHGGDDFLRKPYSEADLFQLLEKHLGVQFQYAEVETIPDELQSESFHSENITSFLQTLPDEVRNRLEKAVSLGDMDSIEESVNEISEINSDAGAYLKNLADDYAYDEMAEYLKSD